MTLSGAQNKLLTLFATNGGKLSELRICELMRIQRYQLRAMIRPLMFAGLFTEDKENRTYALTPHWSDVVRRIESENDSIQTDVCSIAFALAGGKK